MPPIRAVYVIRFTARRLHNARAAMDTAPTPLAQRLARCEFMTARKAMKAAASSYRRLRTAGYTLEQCVRRVAAQGKMLRLPWFQPFLELEPFTPQEWLTEPENLTLPEVYYIDGIAHEIPADAKVYKIRGNGIRRGGKIVYEILEAEHA